MLAPGSRLGTYEILSPLGAGGMGEVYRATDLKLGRDVAIKVLPHSFSTDPERKARFRREAQMLAALNHSHIAAIYGLEEANGSQFLILELVEGETLDRRIAKGTLPVDEALGIAKQIAEALEAAHEKGIIHRDLKPSNIALTPEGQVKVLDFGLAKLAASEPTPSSSVSMSPTITSPALVTGVGTLLGSAAYMSPEQAKGREADRRSDVWAFGCVLYEMLAGRRAFDGEDVADTLAVVLRGEPDWSALSPDLPSSVRALVKRCLTKDRRQRVGDIAAALFVLREPSEAAAIPRAATARWRRAAPLLIGVIAMLAAAMWSVTRPSILRPGVVRLAITVPEDGAVTRVATNTLTISPDGANVVWVANRAIYLRPMSSGEAKAVPITGVDGAYSPINPAFSPAGDWIVFYSAGDRTLKKVAVSGGAAVTLCSADTPYGIHWGPDGILFGQRSDGIMRVSADGGKPDVLVKVGPDALAAYPQILPDGDSLLFTLAMVVDRRATWDQAVIVVQSLSTGRRTTLIEGSSHGRYVPSGHLIYAVGGVLYARTFDPSRNALGQQVPVVAGIRRGSGTGQVLDTGPSSMQLSVSDSGTLVYIPGPVSTSPLRMRLVMTDRNRKVTPLNLRPVAYQFPRISPLGNQIVYGTDDGKEAAIWVHDLGGTTSPRKLTFQGQNRYPVWSSDGRWIAFQSDREGSRAVFRQRLDDETGKAERITTPEEGTSHAPEAWHGETLLFSATKASDVSLHVLSMSTGRTSRFSDVKTSRWPNAAFSRDGRWVAYSAITPNQTRESLYVEPFPPTGGNRHEISTADAHFPVWSRDELLYLDAERRNDTGGVGLVAIPLSNKPGFPFGDERRLIPRRFNVTAGGIGRSRTFDITPDGQQFIGVDNEQEPQDGQSSSQIQIVLNWFEELKRLVPMD